VAINPKAPQKGITAQIGNFAKLLNKNIDYPTLNRAAFNASWGAAAIASGAVGVSERTPSWYANSFKFCNLGNGIVCSVAVWHITDQLSKLVSLYKYELNNGSCSDSFTIPDASW
jgi:hypothetical protein